MKVQVFANACTLMERVCGCTCGCTPEWSHFKGLFTRVCVEAAYESSALQIFWIGWHWFPWGSPQCPYSMYSGNAGGCVSLLTCAVQRTYLKMLSAFDADFYQISEPPPPWGRGTKTVSQIHSASQSSWSQFSCGFQGWQGRVIRQYGHKAEWFVAGLHRKKSVWSIMHKSNDS